MTNIKPGEAKALPYIHFFVYLQVLDLLTTLVGLKFGVGEASPFVRLLMNWGPAVGCSGVEDCGAGAGRDLRGR